MTDDLPQGLQLTALDPVFRDDPYPRLKELRARCPVRRDPFLGVVQLTRYADVRSVLTDRSLWRDPIKAREDSMTHKRALQERAESGGRRQSILTSDDPDHGRVRGLITPILYKRFAASRGHVDAIVEARIARLAGRPTADLIGAYAVPIPIEVIARVLGVDPDRLEEFRGWSEAIIHTFNPARSEAQTEEMKRSALDLQAYLEDLMASRRKSPADDLISDLVQLKDGGAPIEDEEIQINCMTLLIAGNLTTTDLIGNGVRLFLTHPDQLAALRRDPSLINAAVEEILRFDPPVDATGRVASEAKTIGGVDIAPRDPLSPSLRAANRDPDVFEDADVFDITRPRPPHVAFGGGAHICLGAPLARIEAQAALLKLLTAFPRMQLSDAPPEWRALPFFRGLSRLDVLLTGS